MPRAITKKTAKKPAAQKKATARSKAASKKASAKKQDAAKVMPYAVPHEGASPELMAFADGVVEHALSLPEAWLDTPWGERAAKVRKKVFLFSGWYQGGFNFSVKLPRSSVPVLDLPFTSPTGYGLGKSGWVSARFVDGDELPPLGLVKEWIEESYCAVAPKKLAGALAASANT